MSQCVVLSDTAVHEILANLSKDEILLFLNEVGTSLKEFSIDNERDYQPEAQAVTRPNGQKILFRMFTSSKGVGTKIITHPSNDLKQQTFANEGEKHRMLALHGTLTLCDEHGFPAAFINAEEVTGYRTSLSALLLYVNRRETANIVVFGAGKQALWHIRLALALRGDEIKKVTFVNRSTEKARSLADQLKKENEAQWKSPVVFGCMDSPESELENVLSGADVVFCTTGSKQPLFPARYITDRKGSCYISAIGSWQAEMIELDPEILKHAKESEQGIIVVDDRGECLHNAGEIIQSKMGSNDMVEVGEVLSYDAQSPTEDQQKTMECIKDGFVVYKSCGVGITDLAAGQALLQIAQKRNIGVTLPV